MLVKSCPVRVVLRPTNKVPDFDASRPAHVHFKEQASWLKLSQLDFKTFEPDV